MFKKEVAKVKPNLLVIMVKAERFPAGETSCMCQELHSHLQCAARGLPCEPSGMGLGWVRHSWLSVGLLRTTLCHSHTLAS